MAFTSFHLCDGKTVPSAQSKLFSSIIGIEAKQFWNRGESF